MNDEIKEILEDNDELMVRYKDNSFECFDTLPKNVLDYITNLQQENERLKANKPCMLNFQECYVVKDYKSRCEKAIEQAKEKIKGYKETIDMLITTSVENKRYEIAELRYRIREQEDLLNILQNGSDSQ